MNSFYHLVGLFSRALRRIAPIVLLLSVCQTSVEASTRSVQREQFQQAKAAIASGDMAHFYALESGLRNYALHGHLQFFLVERFVKQGDLAEAKRKALRFEKEFHGGFLAWRIMRAYRQRLRDEEQWKLLLESASFPSTPKMACETLRAKDELGRLSATDSELIALWGRRSWGEDCAWVMERQLTAGRVTAQFLWQRVYTLMDAGRLKQVLDFKKHFNARDQSLIQAWIEGHDEPALALSSGRWHSNTPLNRNVFKHLISRLSRSDVKSARLFWMKAHQQRRYDEETRTVAAKKISMRAASDFEPSGLDWLHWLPEQAKDKSTRAARIRLAIRLGRWPLVLEAIDALPSSERDLNDWNYWSGVAKLETGRVAEGESELGILSETRSYYGFMAADRMGAEYQMQNAGTPAEPSVRSALQTRADVQRMREYLFVGLRGEAQAEWKALIKKLDADQRAELSLLTLDWGWFDRAIVTNGRTPYADDLRVRFPFAYKKTMQLESSRHQLSLPWVYGVARRESLFQPEVRSGVGAVGLMQMMPRTAADVAKRARKKLYIGALENPEFNIALGTFYLRYLLNRFDGHEVLATAGYNAGPSRAPRWLGEEPMLADRWVESIPYRETRDYVKAVMAYATVYDWRLDGRVDTRLSQRMPVLPARS